MLQGLGPDGGFVVQCTNPSPRSSALASKANALTAASPADPTALAASPLDGFPVTNTTGIDALVPATPGVLGGTLP